tara:strand:+ start:1665 stop:2414 length:750 start_codon:yes stop_codon:yes gene_type:complete
MVARTGILLLIGTLTFCTSIIINLPASLFSGQIDRVVQNLKGLQLGKISGTIWKGSLETKYREFPVTSVSWNAAFFPIILGRLNLDLSLDAAGLEGKSDLSVSGDAVKLTNLDLEINSSFINATTGPYGLRLSESFTVTAPEIYVSNNWPSKINGRLVWPGGVTEIETPLERLRTQLPMLRGIAKIENKEVKLYIYSKSEEIIILSLNRLGWAKAEINHLFFEIAKIPFPASGAVNQKDPAIIMEEKIL